jgi:hypothetical protein
VRGAPSKPAVREDLLTFNAPVDDISIVVVKRTS